MNKCNCSYCIILQLCQLLCFTLTVRSCVWPFSGHVSVRWTFSDPCAEKRAPWKDSKALKLWLWIFHDKSGCLMGWTVLNWPWWSLWMFPSTSATAAFPPPLSAAMDARPENQPNKTLKVWVEKCVISSWESCSSIFFHPFFPFFSHFHHVFHHVFAVSKRPWPRLWSSQCRAWRWRSHSGCPRLQWSPNRPRPVDLWRFFSDSETRNLTFLNWHIILFLFFCFVFLFLFGFLF